MNVEQVKSAVRWAITFFGPYVILRGWVSATSLETAGALVVALAPFVWSMFNHTDNNAVSVVDELAKKKDSPVKAVILEPTAAGKELAESLPGSTTVVAGSQAAISKAQ